jgi:exonuclease V gamma subunit
VNAEIAGLLTELVEKVGLLRRDLQQKKELEKYEARFARIEQKFSALAERISRDDPELAKALRTAWQLPARSLAFRNTDHQKKLKAELAPKPDSDPKPEPGNS